MRIDVLGIGFDNLKRNEAVEKSYSLMQERVGSYIVTPNPEIVMRSRENEQFKNAVNSASLVVADGIGIIYGAKILKRPLKEKIPGIELVQDLFAKMAVENKSVYLFGARPGVAEKAAERLQQQYSGLAVCGWHDGYFADDADIIQDINNLQPDLLLVCLGAPMQEMWMHENSGTVKAGLMIGAGGSLDVFSGEVERAPTAWQRLGLEWLHRLLKNPSRIGRMMQLPKFLMVVFGEKMKK